MHNELKEIICIIKTATAIKNKEYFFKKKVLKHLPASLLISSSYSTLLPLKS